MMGTSPWAIMKKIYQFMAAMQTGLVLLVMVGLAAALGSTFLPDIFYKTIAFKLLILLLLLNLTLCTLRQLSWLYVVFSNGVPSRQLLRQVGLCLLHLGMVFIIAGGAVYAYFGQSGEIHMLKDKSVDISRVMNVKNGFSLHLDDFKIQFNEDGSTSQYYSYLTVLKNAKADRQAAISVNHPLNYGGVKVYQMSFGYLIKVKQGNAEGQQNENMYREGDLLKIPGTQRVLKVFRYLPNYDPQQGMNSKTMRPDNPRIIFSVYENERFLGVGAARFGERVKLDADNYVVFTGVEPYTVLKLKSDPGVPLVLAGGVMLTLGIVMAWLAAVRKRKLSQSGIRIDERASLLIPKSKHEQGDDIDDSGD